MTHRGYLAGAAVLVGSLAAPSHAARPPGDHLLYVCAQDAAKVVIIDMDRNEIATTIDLQALGFPANAKPHHVVVEPDGSHWYVSLIGANRVVKFSRANEVEGQAEFEAPGMMALHPSRDLLFVGRSMSAVNPPPRIGVIERSDMDIDEVEVLYPRPHALAVDPSGRYVYTASLGENEIMTMAVDDERITVTDVPGPHHSFVQFAYTPDGTHLVVGGEMSGQLMVFDATRPPGLALERTLTVRPGPWHPVFTPDGRYLVFGDQLANTITIVDARNWTVAKVLTGEGVAEPHGSAVSPDGRYAYVSNRNLHGTYGGDTSHGTVVVIDMRTLEIAKVIPVPAGATGLGTAAAR